MSNIIPVDIFMALNTGVSTNRRLVRRFECDTRVDVEEEYDLPIGDEVLANDQEDGFDNFIIPMEKEE